MDPNRESTPREGEDIVETLPEKDRCPQFKKGLEGALERVEVEGVQEKVVRENQCRQNTNGIGEDVTT